MARLKKATPPTDGSDPFEDQKSINGAACVTEQGQVGGERNTSSTTNNYDVTKEECNITRVIGVTETVISAAPAFLLGIIYNTGSSGTATLRDASVTGGASTGKFVVDATRDVNPKATRFETGLTSTGSAAGTDISILWRPI